MATEFKKTPRWLSAPPSRESGTNSGAEPRPNPLPKTARAMTSPSGRDPRRGLDSAPDQAQGGPRDGFKTRPAQDAESDVAAPYRDPEAGPPQSYWEARRREIAGTTGPQDPRDGANPTGVDGEAASPTPPERRPYGGMGPADPSYRRGS